jgi:hypothetical protein
VHHLQQRIRPGADLRIGQAVLATLETQAVLHVAAHAQVREQRVVLEHHADAAALDRARGDVLVAKAHGAAGIRRLQPGDDAQRGGLAAARGAEQDDGLAGADVEVERVQHALAAEVLAAAAQLDRYGGEMEGFVTHRDGFPEFVRMPPKRCISTSSGTIMTKKISV